MRFPSESTSMAQPKSFEELLKESLDRNEELMRRLAEL